MDCVDCHNRPSHILQSPDRSVDLALADRPSGRVTAVPQAAGRSGAYRGLTGTDIRRCRESDSALDSYYQKTYPQVYADKRQAITAAVVYLQETYNRYFFPG